jgi:hypothetical protein
MVIKSNMFLIDRRIGIEVTVTEQNSNSAKWLLTLLFLLSYHTVTHGTLLMYVAASEFESVLLKRMS